MSNKRGLSVDFPIALCTATFLAEKVWNIEFELKAAGEGSALYEPLQYFTNGKDEFTDTQMRKQRRHLANKTDHILINISLEIGITYPLTSILPISGHALSLSWNLYNPYTLIQSYSLLKTTLEFVWLTNSHTSRHQRKTTNRRWISNSNRGPFFGPLIRYTIDDTIPGERWMW